MNADPSFTYRRFREARQLKIRGTPTRRYFDSDLLKFQAEQPTCANRTQPEKRRNHLGDDGGDWFDWHVFPSALPVPKATLRCRERAAPIFAVARQCLGRDAPALRRWAGARSERPNRLPKPYSSNVTGLFPCALERSSSCTRARGGAARSLKRLSSFAPPVLLPARVS